MRETEAFLNAGTLEFIESLYQLYREDPEQLEPSWRAYFDGEVRPTDTEREGPRRPRPPRSSIFNPPPLNGAARGSSVLSDAPMQMRLARVYQLVNAYRVRGHLRADLDPLDLRFIPPHPELDPSWYGFTEEDMGRDVPNGGFFGPPVMKLRELMAALEETYCGAIGVEFMNIQDPEQKAWLQERMETSRNRYPLAQSQQIRILEKLVAAETLERFLHMKYVGTKRFSLEGAESLIPLLDVVLEQAAEHDIREVVMGMPHRGRLNVLCNILGKPAADLFAQFEDFHPQATLGSGDVKYHLGYSSDVSTSHGRSLHLTLTSNPSHLEAVNPVVEGRSRAKQDRAGDSHHNKLMPLLIHGDAAFAGQGLVAETLNLAGLAGYRTGGTLHIVVNNQIGFTTTPAASRSTPYSTDIAKMMQVPIFHVNGEDPEAVAQVAMLAIAFRQRFHKDVVIDMFCFRKYGHNEADEPSFTQPLMYERIRRHPSVLQVYAQRMVNTGRISRKEADDIVAGERARLEKEYQETHKSARVSRPESMKGLWASYRGGEDRLTPEVETAVPIEVLGKVSEALSRVPEGFTVHRKIRRMLDRRREMTSGRRPMDWAAAEALAFGTLLLEGTHVRLSGQDSRRGTFSHRHAVLIDMTNGREYYPLAHVSERQGRFHVYDSSLSEAGVLGFEYGYSLDAPDMLVLWEAQFGDFANGAQVIIDNFLVAGEFKWKRLSGVVLLLPHGYEGQGPEHSSARLERFLQMCARDNIQVVNPTTPAQYFHLLRRQVLRPLRKPLVVMSPKSLLRHPAATSLLSELSGGSFHRILPDPEIEDGADVERILLCSGKVYYDLVEARKGWPNPQVPIVRLEQLYPLRDDELVSALSRWPSARTLSWVQEEPRNMGAWLFMQDRLQSIFGSRYVIKGHYREENATTATGSSKAHQIESKILMEDVANG